MYVSGISHPMPAAPTARPPYTTDSGTGRSRFAGGRSSGTVALNPPVELTCDAKPVSVIFDAPCDPDGAACPHDQPQSAATIARALPVDPSFKLRPRTIIATTPMCTYAVVISAATSVTHSLNAMSPNRKVIVGSVLVMQPIHEHPRSI